MEKCNKKTENAARTGGIFYQMRKTGIYFASIAWQAVIAIIL